MNCDFSFQKAWARANTARMLRQIKALRFWLQVSTILATMIASIAGLLLAVAPDSNKSPWLIAGIGGLFVVLTLSIIMLFIDITPPDAVMRMLDLVDQAEDAERTQKSREDYESWLATLYAVAITCRSTIEQHGRSFDKETYNQFNVISGTLDIAMKESTKLFGFDGGGWGLSVYQFDQAVGVLKCLVTRRSSRLEEEAPHRAWPPGQGHVGQAYARRYEMVADDTSLPAVKDLFDGLGPNYEPDDTRHYRSIASLPIYIRNNETWGVVVATSSKTGNFRKLVPAGEIDHVEPVRLLASTLETMLHIAH